MDDANAAIANHTPADDAGAVAVEYALLASLIAAAIAGTVLLFRKEVAALFEVPWP